jgi:hypothetical protein
VRPNTVTIWTATAHNQPLSTRLGERSDRGLLLVGMQKRWPLTHSENGRIELAYTADLLPVVVSSAMPDYVTVVKVCGRWCTYEETMPTKPQTVYGFGAAPVGFVARYRASSLVGVQLRASGGIVYFSRPVPDPVACKLNFTADVVLVADIRLARWLALESGLRFNHISNGGRSRVNPGMNSRMVELGLALRQ